MKREIDLANSMKAVATVPSVTLVVEIQDQGFPSHKTLPLLQFGTNIYLVGLSLTFKKLK